MADAKEDLIESLDTEIQAQHSSESVSSPGKECEKKSEKSPVGGSIVVLEAQSFSSDADVIAEDNAMAGPEKTKSDIEESHTLLSFESKKEGSVAVSDTDLKSTSVGVNTATGSGTDDHDELRVPVMLQKRSYSDDDIDDEGKDVGTGSDHPESPIEEYLSESSTHQVDNTSLFMDVECIDEEEENEEMASPADSEEESVGRPSPRPSDSKQTSSEDVSQMASTIGNPKIIQMSVKSLARPTSSTSRDETSKKILQDYLQLRGKEKHDSSKESTSKDVVIDKKTRKFRAAKKASEWTIESVRGLADDDIDDDSNDIDYDMIDDIDDEPTPAPKRKTKTKKSTPAKSVRRLLNLSNKSGNISESQSSPVMIGSNMILYGLPKVATGKIGLVIGPNTTGGPHLTLPSGEKMPVNLAQNPKTGMLHITVSSSSPSSSSGAFQPRGLVQVSSLSSQTVPSSQVTRPAPKSMMSTQKVVSTGARMSLRTPGKSLESVAVAASPINVSSKKQWPERSSEGSSSSNAEVSCQKDDRGSAGRDTTNTYERMTVGKQCLLCGYLKRPMDRVFSLRTKNRNDRVQKTNTEVLSILFPGLIDAENVRRIGRYFNLCMHCCPEIGSMLVYLEKAQDLRAKILDQMEAIYPKQVKKYVPNQDFVSSCAVNIGSMREVIAGTGAWTLLSPKNSLVIVEGEKIKSRQSTLPGSEPEALQPEARITSNVAVHVPIKDKPWLHFKGYNPSTLNKPIQNPYMKHKQTQTNLILCDKEETIPRSIFLAAGKASETLDRTLKLSAQKCSINDSKECRGYSVSVCDDEGKTGQNENMLTSSKTKSSLKVKGGSPVPEVVLIQVPHGPVMSRGVQTYQTQGKKNVLEDGNLHSVTVQRESEEGIDESTEDNSKSGEGEEASIFVKGQCSVCGAAPPPKQSYQHLHTQRASIKRFMLKNCKTFIISKNSGDRICHDCKRQILALDSGIEQFKDLFSKNRRSKLAIRQTQKQRHGIRKRKRAEYFSIERASDDLEEQQADLSAEHGYATDRAVTPWKAGKLRKTEESNTVTKTRSVSAGTTQAVRAALLKRRKIDDSNTGSKASDSAHKESTPKLKIAKRGSFPKLEALINTHFKTNERPILPKPVGTPSVAVKPFVLVSDPSIPSVSSGPGDLIPHTQIPWRDELEVPASVDVNIGENELPDIPPTFYGGN